MKTNLQICIENSGYKKQDIASALGVTAVTVSNWCSGKAIPRKAHIIRLSEVLNTSPDILSGNASIPLPDTYEEFKSLCEQQGFGMTDIFELLQKKRKVKS